MRCCRLCLQSVVIVKWRSPSVHPRRPSRLRLLIDLHFTSTHQTLHAPKQQSPHLYRLFWPPQAPSLSSDCVIGHGQPSALWVYAQTEGV